MNPRLARSVHRVPTRPFSSTTGRALIRFSVRRRTASFVDVSARVVTTALVITWGSRLADWKTTRIPAGRTSSRAPRAGQFTMPLGLVQSREEMGRRGLAGAGACGDARRPRWA